MSDSSRSRRKHKLEPISLEELANTTGMSGFVSFLTRDQTVPVPVLDTLVPAEEILISAPATETSALEWTAPASSASVSTAPERSALGSELLQENGTETRPSAPVTSAVETSALESGAPDTGAPGSSEPETSAPVFGFPRRIRIREAVTVQDGHSLGEQAVYDAMYRAGKPYQGDSRILTIGLRTLAELARMTYPNCKANVRSLVAKLAIDERPGFSYTAGRTYIVYSFREILRSRIAAGLTHVIRSRGVTFVDPATGKPMAQSSALDSSAPAAGAPRLEQRLPETSAPASAEISALVPAEKSALPSGADIRNRHSRRNSTQSSSAEIAAVAQTLSKYGPTDDAGTDELIRLCRKHAPDATAEEIADLIRQKIGAVSIRGSVFGFLKTALPRCFVGESFRLFREERRKVAAQEQSRNAELAREILADPQSDSASVEWARQLLKSLRS